MRAIGEDVDECPSCHKKQSEYQYESQWLRPGTLLNGRYEIGAVLGQGGFGITYIGFNTILNTRVAVKEYFPSAIAKRNTQDFPKITITQSEDKDIFVKERARFLEEARNLAQFESNQNIVNVKDYFILNDTAYIVMEFIEGITLDEEQTKHKKKYTFDEAYALLHPIIDALEEVHRAGLIHRDVSPANIMVQPNNKAKLMDFGSARKYGGAASGKMTIVLKPGYAPVEQYGSTGHQGTYTDVYSVCATIYRMITGVVPTNSQERMASDTLRRPTQLGASISPKNEAALMKGLAVLPENRIQTMTELKTLFAQSEQTFNNTVRTQILPGTVVNNPQRQMYAGNRPMQGNVRLCPHCRTIIPSNIKFCTHCGGAVGQTAGQPPVNNTRPGMMAKPMPAQRQMTAAPARKKTNWPVIFSVAVVVLIIGVVLIARNVAGKRDSSATIQPLAGETGEIQITDSGNEVDADAYAEAYAEFSNKNYEKAIEILNGYLEKNPTSSKGYVLRGNAYYQLSLLHSDNKQYYDLAIQDYNAAKNAGATENVDSNLSNSYLRMADFMLDEGDTGKAKDYLEASNSLIPTISTQNRIKAVENGGTYEDGSGVVINAYGDAIRRSNYDVNGMLVWYHDFTYDRFHRVTSVSSYDKNGTLTGTFSDFEYDANGRKLKDFVYEIETGIPVQYSIISYNDAGLVTELNSYDITTGTYSSKTIYLYEDDLQTGYEVYDANGVKSLYVKYVFDDSGNLTGTDIYDGYGNYQSSEKFESASPSA